MFDISRYQRWMSKSYTSIGLASPSAVLRMLVLICTAIVITGHAHAADVVDMQLRWHHQFQFAGYYAAVEKGFYKEVMPLA